MSAFWKRTHKHTAAFLNLILNKSTHSLNVSPNAANTRELVLLLFYYHLVPARVRLTSSWVCFKTAVIVTLTFWNDGYSIKCSVSVSSLGCHSVIGLVTIDLDSKIGQPPSWRRDSDNHVIHHSGTEPNTQVRKLKLAVNPHLHRCAQ